MALDGKRKKRLKRRFNAKSIIRQIIISEYVKGNEIITRKKF